MNQNLTPLIFLPGVFGSMSDVIIPGTGDWSFGVAKVAYGPFIELLELMGFKLNENLFICFYDWRKSCDNTAENYLVPKINEVKEKTGSEQVNILCHSMGGLITRSYIQSDYYNNDVSQAILMATPNTGAAAKFSYWTGGEMPRVPDYTYSLVKAYMKIYLDVLMLKHPLNPIKAIHNEFPGLSNLMPSEQYGDYLYTKSVLEYNNYIPQKSMFTHNTYLNELNKNVDIIKERNIDITVIAGIGERTVRLLQVDKACSLKKWIDGEVVDYIDFCDGDGSISLNSVFFLDGDKYTVEGSHIDMMYKSEPIIRQKLFSKED